MIALETTVLTTTAEISSLTQEWHDLSVAVPNASCFTAPSYFKAWSAVAGADVAWSVLTVRRGEDLIAVMPLMHTTVRRGPSCAPRHDFVPSDRTYLGENTPRPFRMRQISPVVSIPAALVGPAPLCQADDYAGAVAAVAMHLNQLDGWDTFAVPCHANTNENDWITALETAGFSPWRLALGREISGIDGLAPFAGIVAAQNRNFRKNIRRAERAADEAGLGFHIWEGAEAVRANLSQLGVVAGQSWKANNTGAGLHIPYDGAQQAFVESLLNTPDLDHDITPILAVAHINDQPVAVLLSLRHGSRLTALLTFRNNIAPQTSPGLLLIGRMIDWAHNRDLAGYDLNLTQNWARHLTNHSAEQNIVVCYSKSLRGRFFASVSRAARHRREGPS